MKDFEPFIKIHESLFHEKQTFMENRMFMNFRESFMNERDSSGSGNQVVNEWYCSITEQ